MVAERTLRRKLQKKSKRKGWRKCPKCMHHVRCNHNGGCCFWHCKACQWKEWLPHWTGKPG